MQSEWKGSGGCSTVTDEVTASKLTLVCPQGDMHTAFEKNQKVGKHSRRIMEGSKVYLHIIPSPLTNIQEREDLCFYWLMKELVSIMLDIFCIYHGSYIDKLIQRLLE